MSLSPPQVPPVPLIPYAVDVCTGCLEQVERDEDGDHFCWRCERLLDSSREVVPVRVYVPRDVMRVQVAGELAAL